MILEAGNSDYGLQQFGFRQYTTVKQEIFAAVKFCGFFYFGLFAGRYFCGFLTDGKVGLVEGNQFPG